MNSLTTAATSQHLLRSAFCFSTSEPVTCPLLTKQESAIGLIQLPTLASSAKSSNTLVTKRQSYVADKSEPKTGGDVCNSLLQQQASHRTQALPFQLNTIINRETCASIDRMTDVDSRHPVLQSAALKSAVLT